MTDKNIWFLIGFFVAISSILLFYLANEGMKTQDMLFDKIPNMTCSELKETELIYGDYLKGDDEVIYKNKQMREKYMQRFTELKC